MHSPPEGTSSSWLNHDSGNPNWTWKELLLKRVPILTWLPSYTPSILWQDMLAGFTVGLTEIPQAIAFAGIAGLPLKYGLYSGFMDGFVYAIFGTCKDVNIGPTSIMGLMIQSHVANMGNDMAVIITFLAGVIIFFLGLMRLGFLVEFFSYPIIAGFTCAASLQIGSSQIKGLLGIPGKANAFLKAWEAVFANLAKIRPWDATLGVASILFLLALKKVGDYGSLTSRPEWSTNRNALGKFLFMLSLARNALVVIMGTTISYCLRDSGSPPFIITGEIDGGFPPFEPPPFSTSFNGTEYHFTDMVREFGATVAFLPLVAILEAISIAKVFSKGKTLDATQELMALGLCNIIGSFVRSMPTTGSFTRTAVNNASGVRTTLAGIFTSFMVILAIAFLTSTFYYVPKATLASVVICAMFYLFDWEAFVVFWRTKRLDFVPFLATLLCCLFISLEYGILIGIAVNLCFVLYASARPKFKIEQIQSGQVSIITPKDTIYFPASEFLRDTVLKCSGDTVIINGKYVRNIDVTLAKTISVLAQDLKLNNQSLILLDFKESIAEICTKIDGNLKDCFQAGTLLQDVLKFEAIPGESPLLLN